MRRKVTAEEAAEGQADRAYQVAGARVLDLVSGAAALVVQALLVAAAAVAAARGPAVAPAAGAVVALGLTPAACGDLGVAVETRPSVDLAPEQGLAVELEADREADQEAGREAPAARETGPAPA